MNKKMKVMIVVVMMSVQTFIATNVFAGSIGNTVWMDANKNGIQDNGERGIPGVKLKLYNGNDVETDKTNSQGRYKFKDLKPGKYTVIVAQETLPEGCFVTYDRDGNKDGKYEDKYIQEEAKYTHADFGYYCPTHVLKKSIMSPRTGNEIIFSICISLVVMMSGFVGFLLVKKNI